MSPAAFVLAIIALAVSASTVVRLPVLGPVSVLGVVALAVVLAIAGAVLLIVRRIVLDWPVRA